MIRPAHDDDDRAVCDLIRTLNRGEHVRVIRTRSSPDYAPWRVVIRHNGHGHGYPQGASGRTLAEACDRLAARLAGREPRPISPAHDAAAIERAARAIYLASNTMTKANARGLARIALAAAEERDDA